MKAAIYSSPLQFAAAVTAEFVAGAAKEIAPSKAVLDVGCGDGLVAGELQKAGLDVIAIDGNEESVKKARSMGVNAQHCKVLDFAHQPFALIMLSRALHHMPPLAETVKKLSSLLSPRGILAIEDFGFELIDSDSAQWLLEQTRAIKANNAVEEPRHKWLWNADNLTPEAACELWKDEHWGKHQILSSREMKAALAEQFVVQSQERPAFLFRYLCDFLPHTTGGAEQAFKIWQQESQLIDSGKLKPVGLRLLLRKS